MIKLSDCPVPILQCEWEFQQFMEMYKGLNPKKILEIGSFYGGTLWFWLKYGIELERVTSVDYLIPPSDGRYTEMMESRKQWSKWVEGLELKLDDIKGDSHSKDVIKRVHDIYPHRDVDMLFIDGDHSYKGVKADFENYKGLVRKEGLIVFHDVIGLDEVRKLWDQVKPHYKYIEIYGKENGWGIGVIEV